MALVIKFLCKFQNCIATLFPIWTEISLFSLQKFYSVTIVFPKLKVTFPFHKFVFWPSIWPLLNNYYCRNLFTLIMFCIYTIFMKEHRVYLVIYYTSLSVCCSFKIRLFGNIEVNHYNKLLAVSSKLSHL